MLAVDEPPTRADCDSLVVTATRSDCFRCNDADPADPAAADGDGDGDADADADADVDVDVDAVLAVAAAGFGAATAGFEVATGALGDGAAADGFGAPTLSLACCSSMHLRHIKVSLQSNNNEKNNTRRKRAKNSHAGNEDFGDCFVAAHTAQFGLLRHLIIFTRKKKNCNRNAS